MPVDWGKFKPVEDAAVGGIDWAKFKPAEESPTPEQEGSKIVPPQQQYELEKEAVRAFKELQPSRVSIPFPAPTVAIPFPQQDKPPVTIPANVTESFLPFEDIKMTKEPKTYGEAIGKGVYNLALALPEFATSTAGMAGALTGTVLPRATAGYFAADMVYNAIKDSPELYEQWNSMTGPQKLEAGINVVGSLMMALGLGVKATKGFLLEPKGRSNALQREMVTQLTELAQTRPEQIKPLLDQVVKKEVPVTQREPVAPTPPLVAEPKKPDDIPAGAAEVLPSATAEAVKGTDVAKKLAEARQATAQAATEMQAGVEEAMRQGAEAPAAASSQAQQLAAEKLAAAKALTPPETEATTIKPSTEKAITKPTAVETGGVDLTQKGAPDAIQIYGANEVSLRPTPEDRGTVGEGVRKEAAPAGTQAEAKAPELTPKAKEPWEMTRVDYLSSEPYYGKLTKPYARLLENHRASVVKAVREGKSVPSEVLSEYPDLAKLKPEPQLTPAILLHDGRKFTGPDHRTIYDEVKKTNPDMSGMQEGFVDANGVFTPREVAASETGLPTKTEEGKLHSGDLPKESKPTTVEEVKTEPVLGDVGMGGAKPAEFEKTKQQLAMKYRDIDADRAKRGLEELTKPESTTDQATLNKAIEAIAENNDLPEQLATELNKKPRAIEDWENHVLLLRRIELKDEYYKAIDRLEQAWKDAEKYPNRALEIEPIRKQINSLETRLENIEEASRVSGSARGRALRALQVLVKEDWTLDNMVRRKRAARGGLGVSDEEKIELSNKSKEFFKKSDQLDKQTAERAVKASETEAAAAIDDVAKAAKKSSGKSLQQKEADFADTVERIRAKIAKNQTSNITNDVKKLAERFWNQGIQKFDPMIDALQGVLKDVIPDITRQQTMDALSGRGRFSIPSQLEVKKGIRDLSQQARLVAHQIDVENRRPLPRTGAQRDPMSKEARQQLQRLNELKRKFGVVVTNKEQQLASALQASKTYIRNRMIDLAQEIKTRERIVTTKTPLEPDAELIKMRQEYDALKKQHAEIFQRPELTPEQRLKMAENAVDRSIASLEDDLSKGIISRPKEPSKVPESARLDEKRAYLAALKEFRQELRDIANPKKTPIQIALQQYRTRTFNRIAEYKRKIAEGDFTVKPKREPTKLGPEEIKLKAELAKIKGEFEEGLERERLKMMSKPAVYFSNIRETLNLSRNAMTSADVSAVLRQGGILSFAHPIIASKSILPMMEVLFKNVAKSRDAARAVEAQIQERDNFKNGIYKQADLYLAPVESYIAKNTEETIRSKWSSQLPVIAQSNNAYITFLNKLRADTFDALHKSLDRPDRPMTPTELRALGNYINVATGRGNFKKLAGASDLLSSVFFSPRLVASRFQMLVGEPILKPLIAGDYRMSGAIAKEYVRYLTAVGLVLGLGTMAGASIEYNPTSSDFLKMKVGNTRLDMFSGLIQASVLLSRLATGEEKDIKGQIKSLVNPKYGGKSWLSEIGRFLKTKFSPAITLGIEQWTGKDINNQDISRLQSLKQHAMPMSFQDLVPIFEEQGTPRAMALLLLSLFGAGLMWYEPRGGKNSLFGESRSGQNALIGESL